MKTELLRKGFVICLFLPQYALPAKIIGLISQISNSILTIKIIQNNMFDWL